MTVFTTGHAALRAAERCGLMLSEADLRRIAKDCAEKRSILLRREPSGQERHAVMVRGVAIAVVISPKGTIVTVLPREAINGVGGGVYAKKTVMRRNRARANKRMRG